MTYIVTLLYLSSFIVLYENISLILCPRDCLTKDDNLSDRTIQFSLAVTPEDCQG